MRMARGFTLIELCVVVAVVALLAAAALPQFQGFVTKSKRVEATINIKAMRQAFHAFGAEKGYVMVNTAGAMERMGFSPDGAKHYAFFFIYDLQWQGNADVVGVCEEAFPYDGFDAEGSFGGSQIVGYDALTGSDSTGVKLFFACGNLDSDDGLDSITGYNDDTPDAQVTDDTDPCNVSSPDEEACGGEDAPSPPPDTPPPSGPPDPTPSPPSNPPPPK